MGKQKDFRRIRHPLHKKKDKQFDKTAKPPRTSCQENYLKSFESVIQQELESTMNAKRIGRHVRKELERYPLLAKVAFLGCERILDSILDAGEDINVQIPDGRTPLILAVENGYTEIVQKLLKKGADPKLLRSDGRNALMIAVGRNDNPTFMAIWSHWDKNSVWELNHTDVKGYTVLTLAVIGGHSNFLSLLLKLNSLELDKQTTEGKTALMFAVTGGQTSVVQSLISCGSDIALEDMNGATAICLAISQNQHEIKALLYESLDRKSRDMYVKAFLKVVLSKSNKIRGLCLLRVTLAIHCSDTLDSKSTKRIELLTRPRPAETAVITAFYKDVLFRVILEIRKSFEDGVVLLRKHRVFAGLYKCLDTHQQNTKLLRIGFHLTACLIYDKADYEKAECRCYIVEEFAEQYVNTKFADFTLKIMQRCQLKGMIELRGAAFLCIQAGTQCRSGKTWLKSNYFQLVPFVKEFKVILSTLTFWGDGESTKAKIMYDRFLEIFELVEKDVNISCIMAPEIISNTVESNTSPGSKDKDTIVISGKLSNISLTGSDRQVASKAKCSKDPKTVDNPAMDSIAKKRDYKKKNKLKNKVHSKINLRKFAQRPNLKFTPNLDKKFPVTSCEEKVTQTCYADVLKKNLRIGDLSNTNSVNGIIYQDDHDFLTNKQTWPRVKAYSLSEIELDYEIDRTKVNSTKMSAENGINVNLNTNDSSNLIINEKQIDENFYDCWKKSSTSKYPSDLMTFITNLFRANELKNQVSSQNALCKNPGLSFNTKDRATEQSEGKQSKALRDILIALGLKTDFNKDDTDESKCTTKNKTDITSKNKCGLTVNEINTNAASGDFLYSDCFKGTPEGELSNKKNLKSRIKKTEAFVTGNAKPVVAQKDTTVVNVFNDGNTEPYLIKNYTMVIEKNKNMTHVESDEELKHCAINDSEIKFSDNTTQSLELQGKNEISNEGNTEIAKDDFNRKFSNSISIKSLKRKNPETYFRDLAFNAYKEEIKDVKIESSQKLTFNFEYCIHLIRNSMRRNKMIKFPLSNVNTVLSQTVMSSKTTENNNGIQSCDNTHRLLASKGEYTELIRRKPTKYIDMISSGDQGMCNLNFERYHEKNIAMASKNLILHEISDDKRLFDELKNVFHMINSGKFSNFDQNCQKFKKNPKFTGTHRSFLSGKSIIIPEMTLNIEKFMFLYKRLIIYQVVDQPHLLVLYMNTQCRLPVTDIKSEFDSKEFAADSKKLKKFDYCHHETCKLNEKKSTILSDEHKMLKQFKSELNQIISYLPVHSTKSMRKQHKYIRKAKNSALTVFNKIKRTKVEVPIPKSTESIDTSFTLCNDAYGYKPNFINCEQRSRWYEKVQRIESCVPLATFLVGFGATQRTKCNLHEIISATGKIVFSSKEEHILREGYFGTHIGIMSNGNPVVVRMFQKTGHKTLELLSTKRHLNHKNIVSFYCLCSSPNDQRIFTVSELVEFSLPECVKMKFIHSNKSLLIRDLLDAIQYFQKMEIVHGFLKPSNVMITLDGRLKVSDFYMMGVTPVVYGIVNKQSTKNPAPIGTSSISDFCWRPYELIAATTEVDSQILLTKASDIQMTGMLIYYILSGGKHPFGSTNVRCQENIRDGTPEFGPRPSDIESRDLVRDMIRRTPSRRLTLQKVTKHPYLWNIVRRNQFLVDVARKIEFFIWKPTKIAESLHDSCIEARDWTHNIHPEILKCVSKWMCKAYVDNYSDLLHFILSIHENFEDLPQEVKSYMVHPSFFISATFPTFFMSVYCVVRDIPSLHQQMALQAYF